MKHGYQFVAAFDVDPKKIGSASQRLAIEHVDRFEEIVKERQVDIGVIAVPPGSAQGVANQLILAGSTASSTSLRFRFKSPTAVGWRTWTSPSA